MKKLLALGFVAAMIPSLALAKGGNHPMGGCGLGYVLFGNSDNTPVMQILAATTNGSSANQTFGMTSGTSGCTEDGAVKFVKEVEVYAEINMKDLSRDMVNGQGEYLSAFARLLGVKAEKQADFGAFVRSNYGALVPSAATTSVEMLNALADKLAGRTDLLG
ncbi:MAG: DUF3015 domain-containing protein [Elusimicrobia bacterium]|nr:DUF3015 domain-containing protein [Elusimicrobiota bacterium]